MNEKQKEHVKNLVVEALMTDGGHHKQWYLERILEALGFDLEHLQHEVLRANGHEWERGIAP